MQKKIVFFTIIICLGLSMFFTQKNAEQEIIVDFYDIKFLQNSPAVEKVIKNKGFFEADFKTDDNLTINTIMLDQSSTHKVKATIISCPGFVPGNKEGMTTLYAMLAKNPYNFMFIDSRGHGKSEGQLLTFQGIKNYGQSEYLDVIAAIKHINTYNRKHNIAPDIIIHGLCSGAYHTIKAVTGLKKSDPEIYMNIKGIVLDSAWPSIPSIIDTIITAESTARCKSYYISFLQPYLAYTMQKIYNTYFKAAHSKQTTITEIINEIDQPILFIHAENDEFVPAHHVYPLIKNTKKPISWFVQNSSHVNSHLDYKDEYKNLLENFIQSVA